MKLEILVGLLVGAFWIFLVVRNGNRITRALRAYRAVITRHKMLCTVCGYSLTANVSGVCPECGTAIDSRWAAHKSPAPKNKQT